MVYQRIRYFLQAADAGSFSKAAEQMYISSQALTRQIKLLEEELGGKLFERSASGVRLTMFGEEAYGRFQKIDEELNRTVEDLQLRASERKPTMNIGIFSALPHETLVTPLISFLLAAYADYQIELNLVELAEGRRLLMQDKMDLLITNTHEEDDWGTSRCFHLEEHEAKVIVSMYHPWAIRQSITREDMQQEIFLKMQMDKNHYILPAEDSFFENIPCRRIKQVSNFDTLFALLQQGKAFAVFPQAFAYMDSAKLKYFDFPGRSFRFYTTIVYNPVRSRGELDKVVEELTEEYGMKR